MGLVGLAGVYLAAISQDAPPLGPFDFVLAAGVSLVGVPILVAAFRPRIRLSREDLTVVNPIGREQVPLAEVVGVEVGWSGVSVDLADGQSITAWAVQKSNLSQWLSLETRADRVAAAISRAAGL